MRTYDLVINGRTYRVEVKSADGEKVHVSVNGADYEVEVAEILPGKPSRKKESLGGPSRGAETVAGTAEVTAPMPGVIIEVLVSQGDEVAIGDVVARMEAMKMENDILATMSGRVTKVGVEEGAEVVGGQVLLTIE